MLRYGWEITYEVAPGTAPAGSILSEYIYNFLASSSIITVLLVIVFGASGCYTYVHNYQTKYKAIVIVQSVTSVFVLAGVIAFLTSDVFAFLAACSCWRGRCPSWRSWHRGCGPRLGARSSGWRSMTAADAEHGSTEGRPPEDRAGDRRRRLHRLGPAAAAAGRGLPRPRPRPASSTATDPIARVPRPSRAGDRSAPTSARSTRSSRRCAASTRSSTWAGSSATRPARLDEELTIDVNLAGHADDRESGEGQRRQALRLRQHLLGLRRQRRGAGREFGAQSALPVRPHQDRVRGPSWWSWPTSTFSRSSSASARSTASRAAPGSTWSSTC